MTIALPSRKLLLLSGGAPSWVLSAGGILPAVGIDIDFVNNRAWVNGAGLVSVGSLLSITRASNETYADAIGNLSTITSGNPAFGNAGLQVWEARTNVVLWNSDLTNAAWTASNITATKDQTGPDNVANSASSILATAGNATILQAITLGSSARFQSAYVKRLIGSGAINMTMDNGATWTAVIVTAGWTRVSIPTQTLTNPTVGFQIVTNGDKIAVMLVGNENGTFASPGIPTTSGAVTRAADVITLTNPPVFGGNQSLFVQYVPSAPISFATDQYGLTISDGTTSNKLSLLRAGTAGRGDYVINSTFKDMTATAQAKDATIKSAVANTPGTQNGAWNSANTGTSAVAAALSGLTTVSIGKREGASSFINGNISRIAIWPTTALSAAQLQQITT